MLKLPKYNSFCSRNNQYYDDYYTQCFMDSALLIILYWRILIGEKENESTYLKIYKNFNYLAFYIGWLYNILFSNRFISWLLQLGWLKINNNIKLKNYTFILVILVFNCDVVYCVLWNKKYILTFVYNCSITYLTRSIDINKVNQPLSLRFKALDHRHF